MSGNANRISVGSARTLWPRANLAIANSRASAQANAAVFTKENKRTEWGRALGIMAGRTKRLTYIRHIQRLASVSTSVYAIFFSCHA
jgi:hypothetical protein